MPSLMVDASAPHPELPIGLYDFRADIGQQAGACITALMKKGLQQRAKFLAAHLMCQNSSVRSNEDCKH